MMSKSSKGVTTPGVLCERRHKSSLLVCTVCLAIVCELLVPGRSISAATAPPTPPTSPTANATAVSITPITTARQQRVFKQFWDIVNERYVYPDFRGIDWPHVRDDMQKRIAAGISDADFYTALSELIDSFNDNHSSFLSPEDAKTEDADYDGTGTFVGIGIISDINPNKRYVFVLTVLPNSPAEKAGIHEHDHILQIDGQPTVGDDGQSHLRLLRGPAGTPVSLVVSTPGQQPHTVTIVRGAVASIEPIRQRVLTGTGRARIGYLLVPSLFESSVASHARLALRDLMKSNNRLDGLILDLRTDGGGTYDNLRALLGFFTAGTMGSLTNRAGNKSILRVRAERIGNSQTVPLIVLTGPGTESFAEVLAATLQTSGRATVIGLNSAGNIEALLSHDFEDGSRLWLAEETFRLTTGVNFEGQGVTPDVRVAVGWDEFTADNDPVIAAALVRLAK